MNILIGLHIILHVVYVLLVFLWYVNYVKFCFTECSLKVKDKISGSYQPIIKCIAAEIGPRT